MPWELVLVVQIRKLVLKSEEQLERLKEQTKALEWVSGFDKKARK